MEYDAIWRHTHAERAALAEALSGFDEDQWAHDTLCPGWTVKDVAAHVISTPQIGWSELGGVMARNLGRGYNTMIYREVKRLGARESFASILRDFATYADSNHHVPMTTSVEPMIDALVHHQDIVRPLGLRHDMAPEAAAVAADRCRLLPALMGSRKLVKGTRMVATDIDWTRGKGPTLEAPMQELLMLCAGRAADPALVSGDGLALMAR